MAGLGLDDVENILAKGFDHLLGLDRPNAAIYYSAEVLFNSIYGSRSRCLHELIFELLLPMAKIIIPLARCSDPLTSVNDRSMALNYQQMLMHQRSDPQNAEPIIGVVTRHPLDQASHDF
jgi:hypothetical protein